MKLSMIRRGLAATAVFLAVPTVAQDMTLAEEPVGSPEAVEPATTMQTKPCELHVWPTENYLGVKMGLFSGFGLVGAVIDQAGHAKGVTTVKDLMRDYLGPEVQMTELDRIEFLTVLGLDPEKYAIIVQEPTPWNEELKDNPELKAEVKAFNKKLKGTERLSDSTNPCYAELVTTHIFYHKAMMYGSNLFTGWVYREFDGSRITRKGTGQVKNPLEVFPPKEEAMIEDAQAELRDAYSKDFIEYVEKKVI
ncbi:MAG: hypothetical protein EP341_08910 [Sphingomonadales bacterium]|nr:MAG: hypothetical protein EP341_08910 [Sphingomonadales bacterium]